MIRISRRVAALGAAGLLAVTGGTIGVTQTQAEARAASGTPTCRLGDLYVSVGPVTGGAGSVFHPLRFTNTSTHTCALRGFPGVSVLDVRHHRIGGPATRNVHPVSTVSIRPGRAVSASVRTNNQGVVPECRPTSTYLRVYPPGSRESVLVPYHLRVCGSFETNPVEWAT